MVIEQPPSWLDEGVLVCNCAGCGRLLASVRHAAWVAANGGWPPVVYDRPGNRPHCFACCQPRPAPSAGLAARREDDGGPWQQNAVRILEGE